VVICHLAGANRDDRALADAEVFAPSREPRSHLAFGHGFHRCVGAALARIELGIAYPALARRFPDLELAVDRLGLDYRPMSIVYGVDRLPVRLG
jgi:cytochrome P450